MLFRARKPASPLSVFIENLWSYEGYNSPHFKERIFPSGTFELVINLRNDELRIYKAADPDRFERFSGATVSGPYSGFFGTDAAEEAYVMGVHFKPGGAFPFLGPPAHEMADAHVNLDALWGRSAAEVREQLSAVASPEHRFLLLEKLLVSRLRSSPEHHGAVALALDRFARHGTRTTTRDLARQAGLSQKRFIDVFRSEVGLAPKTFNRIVRFQRVLADVHRRSAADWTHLALEYGYFDQSHLIRDFLAFSGLCPADYLGRLRDLREKGLLVKFNHLPQSR